MAATGCPASLHIPSPSSIPILHPLFPWSCPPRASLPFPTSKGSSWRDFAPVGPSASPAHAGCCRLGSGMRRPSEAGCGMAAWSSSGSCLGGTPGRSHHPRSPPRAGGAGAGWGLKAPHVMSPQRKPAFHKAKEMTQAPAGKDGLLRRGVGAGTEALSSLRDPKTSTHIPLTPPIAGATAPHDPQHPPDLLRSHRVSVHLTPILLQQQPRTPRPVSCRG